MEENLRQAMIIARGDLWALVSRPISAAILTAAAGLVLIALMPKIRKGRARVFVEAE
jgi:putative tricarboxylic transport membrane protein